MHLPHAAPLVSAAVLSAGLGLVGMPPALAAGSATITVDSVVTSGEPTNLGGTCPDTAAAAAVTVTAGSVRLLATSYPVTGGGWAGTTTVTGPMGNVEVTVSCLGPGDAPLATASETVLLFAMPDPGKANVSVSPARVALGATLTVTAACPPGSASGGVYLFIGDFDPYAGTAAAMIGSRGVLTATFPVALHRPPGSSAPAPVAGPSTAVVFCADSAGMPTGTGSGNYTITAAPVQVAGAPPAGTAVPPPTSSASPARPAGSAVRAATSVVPGLDITELPATGARTAPLAALGLGLLLFGSGLVAGAHGLLPRPVRHHRDRLA